MKIDKHSETPIYMQIYNNIVDEIINGYLIPEERLPSRRKLCEELGIAQRTVENAYQKLVADEYVVSRPKSGYFVSYLYSALRCGLYWCCHRAGAAALS